MTGLRARVKWSRDRRLWLVRAHVHAYGVDVTAGFDSYEPALHFALRLVGLAES